MKLRCYPHCWKKLTEHRDKVQEGIQSRSIELSGEDRLHTDILPDWMIFACNRWIAFPDQQNISSKIGNEEHGIQWIAKVRLPHESPWVRDIRLLNAVRAAVVGFSIWIPTILFSNIIYTCERR